MWHGPNLNLFGRREPHIYGTTTLAEINAKLEHLAKENGVELVIFQSNHEGVLVDRLHELIDSVDGAIINPAGLTQYGVSLHDAIKAMPFPVVEVHMRGYADAQARHLFRDLIDTPADVTITEREVQVRFHRRAHLPIIIASGILDVPVKVPWWHNHTLRMSA